MAAMQHTTKRYRALSPVLVLALALLLAQVLGLMHGVAHAPLAAAGQPGQGPLAGDARAASGQPAQAWDLASLFSGHHDDSDCRVYDQLGHGDGMPGVLSPAPLLPAAVFILFACCAGIAARTLAPFQARGPPSVR